MQAFFTHVALVVMLPALGGIAILLVAWPPWRRRGAPAGGRWATGVALAVCLAMSILAADGLPTLPPRESWQWLAYLALMAGLWSCIEARERLPGAARLTGRLTLAACAAWLLTRTWVEGYWLWRLIGFATITALAGGLIPLARRARGATLPLVLCIGTSGASILLVLGHGARQSELAGAVATLLAATTALAWWRPSFDVGAGGIVAAAVLVPGLLVSGYYASYSTVPSWCYVLAAVAPLAAWAGEFGVFARLRPWKQTAVRGLFVVVPVAIALGVAAWRTLESEADPW